MQLQVLVLRFVTKELEEIALGQLQLGQYPLLLDEVRLILWAAEAAVPRKA